MKITYIFDSYQLPHGHDRCLTLVKEFATRNMYLYEYIDVSKLSHVTWQSMIEKWGVIVPPMIVSEDKVIHYDVIVSMKQFMSLFVFAKKALCPAESILLYS